MCLHVSGVHNWQTNMCSLQLVTRSVLQIVQLARESLNAKRLRMCMCITSDDKDDTTKRVRLIFDRLQSQ